MTRADASAAPARAAAIQCENATAARMHDQPPTEAPPAPAAPSAPAGGDHAPALAAALGRPGIWSGFGIVAAYLALQFALSLAVGTMIGLAYALKAGLTAGLQHRKPDVGTLVQSLQANPDVRAVVVIITITLAALMIGALVHRLWPSQWSRADLPGFGLVRPEHPSAYATAIALGLGVVLLGGFLTHLLAGSHAVQQDIAVMGDEASLALRMPLLVLVVAAAPFVEELVFRGVLLSGLARRMPVGRAIIASALVFGAVHLPDFKFAWYPVPALVMLGIVLAWIRVRTRSLWPAIALHATNNLIAALGWFLVAHH